MSPANPSFLICKPTQVHPALRHVGDGFRNVLNGHRDFCLTKYAPFAGTRGGWVLRDTPGQHFQVEKIQVTRAYITCTVFVVVRFPAWEALNASGRFFQAIGPQHPRADIDFARHHPDAAHFPNMDTAVRAAVDALLAETAAGAKP